MKKIAAFFLSICLLLLSLSGCAPEKRERTYYGYFDTSVTVIDYSGESESSFNRKTKIITDLLDCYHKLLDIYNDYEGVVNLKTVNDSAGNPVKVSRELFDLLSSAQELCNVTEGEMNIALGAVLRLWHDAREAGNYLPSPESLSEAAAHTDIDKIYLDRESLTVTLLDGEMSLDVGAIGKGYVAGVIAAELEKKGVSSLILNLGGNVTAIGHKPDGSSWRTGVENPGGSYFALFNLADSTVSTSGDYERYFTYGGKNYHHIIDKDTLYPAESFKSVTVVSDNPALADALSTALFCMPLEAGQELAVQLRLKVLWVYSDGSAVPSEDGFFEIAK